MLSIIICSRKATVSKDFLVNITETIGCIYELIIIDNSENKYSIFEAYNLGMKKSKGNYWCFIHDDIFIQTNNWGKHIEEVFSINPEFGLLGIAGGKIKTKMPSAWWDAGNNVLKLKQHHWDGSSEIWNQGFEGNEIEEVAAIDGVFMAMRKNEQITFDENLKGFHNYDIYLSLKLHILNKKVIVTNRIFIEHFSQGNLDKSWLEATSLFHKLYKKYLPIYIKGKFEKEYIRKLEYKTGTRFINKLIEQKMYNDAIYWWYEILKIHPYSKYHYRFWKSILKEIIC